MEKQKGRKLRKILLTVLAVTMLFSMQALAAGTKTVNMQKASNGGYVYYGAMKDKKTTVYHKFTVKKAGVLAVTGVGVSSSGKEQNLRVFLCNSKKKSLERTSKGSVVNVNKSQDSGVKLYGVKKGTYYIRVTGEAGYGVSAVDAAVTDKGGASKKKATTVKKGAVVTGVMPAGEKASKADWFKFKVTQKRILELNLETAGDGKFDFYLYGPGYKGYRVASFMNGAKRCYSANGSRKAKVNKGTYYLKVVRNSSSAYKKSSGIYSVKWLLH